ncbi:hypothetical protein DID88_010088 [Monilinia fructigena]|uniref:Uncharacterized protein n=1 Tax=Monilinia fructigena TaxID=38457 RepID=A0A395IKU9_9HELO|nr:hypothetical protein DID88_010088 [Monilinia fructigena]
MAQGAATLELSTSKVEISDLGATINSLRSDLRTAQESAAAAGAQVTTTPRTPSREPRVCCCRRRKTELAEEQTAHKATKSALDKHSEEEQELIDHILIRTPIE